jgi:putative membrane protein
MSSERRVGPRHLHRAAIVSGALDNLREIAIAVIVGMVLQAGAGNALSGVTLVLALGGAATALVVGYLRWANEWYEVDGDALRHRRGIVSPDETVVPLARIQAIDVSQGPVQRLFGVHAVHVQTAGGGASGEIELRALDAAGVQALRAVAGLPEPAAQELPEWRLGAGGLLVTALTAPQFGVILPLLGGAAAVLENALSGDAARGLVDRVPTDAPGIARLLVAVALLSWLVSFAGAIVAFAGFSVVRDGERLRIRRGLLQRRTASVPVGRVHAVDIVESILRQPFGLAAVRVEVAGYREEPAAAQTLFPVLRMTEVDELLRGYVPHLGGALGRLERPPARARRRYVLPSAFLVLLIGGAIALAWHSAWLAVPVLTLLGALDGWSRYRAAGWRLTAEAIVIRRRWLTPARGTLVARLGRLQEHSLRQSPFQRRAGLANLGVAVGSGRRGRVEELELDTAVELFERLRITAAVTTRAGGPPVRRGGAVSS